MKYNADGLVPCVVQSVSGGEVLMVAYADATALRATLETGDAHFWSRSRRELWHKGATSGNTQRVVTARLDCDHDTVLLEVEPAGPACHTGAVSCFRDDANGGAATTPAASAPGASAADRSVPGGSAPRAIAPGSPAPDGSPASGRSPATPGAGGG